MHCKKILQILFLTLLPCLHAADTDLYSKYQETESFGFKNPSPKQSKNTPLLSKQPTF